MMNVSNCGVMERRWPILLVVWVALILAPAVAMAHGPKPHNQNSPTPLAVLKKGLSLFDKLVSSGKLDETWETGLKGASIGSREHDGRTEHIVTFERMGHQPEAVYIFFDAMGEYSGSNFTGE